MDANLPTDEDLLVRIIAGNEDAFSILLDRHLESVRNLAWRILGQHDAVDDLAQDVFVKIWQKPESFQPGKAKFSTWLYRVTMNACIDRKRKKLPLPSENIDETIADRGPGPEAAIIASQTNTRVENAIAALPERQRMAICLSYYHCQSNSETARVLQCSIEAVESLLGRARRTLRQKLNSEINELLGGTG